MARTARERELRAEYSRISRRLRQQLKRLTAARPQNNLQDWLRGEFPSLREIGTISNKGLQMLTGRAKRLYQSGMLTIPKYEASLVQSAKTLNESGYDFVTPNNVENMWRFIDEMRSRGLADIYGYRYFIDVYNRINEDKKLTSEQLERSVNEWTEYAEKFKQKTAAAMARGKQGPRAKELRFSRKPQRNSSSNDYRR